jgi:hypothetical protein
MIATPYILITEINEQISIERCSSYERAFNEMIESLRSGLDDSQEKELDDGLKEYEMLSEDEKFQVEVASDDESFVFGSNSAVHHDEDTCNDYKWLIVNLEDCPIVD